MERKMLSYQTHDNGSRPFTVEISDTVSVYLNPSNELIFTFIPDQVFIGKNELCMLSDCEPDKKYDGNSILLNIIPNCTPSLSPGSNK